ncbi:leucyl aminopeptidase family protein [Qingshengfaniella alkalisoli]|uniref:Leucyl aminopeptidase family protein n=1 Tax=Qingshengfaniella alkalisoli TaxID=2599296 RepID=A0A5B8IUI2_9RHOB|nr:leucyl aminopeptidase family protein [Qingshengfaniella alkalisoli]QDY69782.1 leucyl aminopeptidase family protein [Qingshengfaniella alkalisoli]
MSPKFAAETEAACPIYLVSPDDLAGWKSGDGAQWADWVTAAGFAGKPGELCLLPTGSSVAGAIFGLGGDAAQSRTRFALAQAVTQLPEGPWRIASDHPVDMLSEQSLAWLLASYRFDRYAAQDKPGAQLVAPKGVDAKRLEAIAAGECLTRDLINTPASDMGPEELEVAAHALAREFGASFDVVQGDGLLEENFPMIHAVGRASPREPRLLDMRWGEHGPRLTLVGKGVCFDTGGLNLKPGRSMGLMKKDMGGAATVLGLARMIMALGLRLRLRVLIPAVENSVSGNSFRPQDVLTSRKGLTVEINNTDAEGRLVLADALAYADEESPDLMVSMATLTGAARVAVGPDLAPFYTNSATAARALAAGGDRARDPVWQMPFHEPYESMIEPDIADLDNAPSGGFAGSITAALFLRRFVEGTQNYVHFDIYGWQPSSAPARPKGGVGQGARALLQALPELLDLSDAT